MSSNIALIGSIVVGGIFLLSVMNFYSDLVDHSIEKGVELRTQQTTANLVDILEYDFKRMGSGLATAASAITSNPDTSDITFFADLDTDGTAETVRYYLGGPATFTENPNDSLLFREVNGTQTIKLAGVRRFSIKLRDMTSAITNTLSDVSMIEMFIEVESTYSYKKLNYANDLYAKAAWRKLITPQNMVRQSNMTFP